MDKYYEQTTKNKHTDRYYVLLKRVTDPFCNDLQGKTIGTDFQVRFDCVVYNSTIPQIQIQRLRATGTLTKGTISILIL